MCILISTYNKGICINICTRSNINHVYNMTQSFLYDVLRACYVKDTSKTEVHSIDITAALMGLKQYLYVHL